MNWKFTQLYLKEKMMPETVQQLGKKIERNNKKPSTDASEFKDFKQEPIRNAVIEAMAASVIPPEPKDKTDDSQPPLLPETPSVPVGTVTDIIQRDDDDVPLHKTVDGALAYILSRPRGHDGKSEKEFANWIMTMLTRMGQTPVLMEEGAIFVEVQATPAKTEKTLFVCHIDTVHSPIDYTAQAIAFDAEFQHIVLAEIPNPVPQVQNPTHWQVTNYKSTVKSGSCLGGDDGCGVWILLNMIQNKVPGGYLFNRGEERGCVGALVDGGIRDIRWIADLGGPCRGGVGVAGLLLGNDDGA